MKTLLALIAFLLALLLAAPWLIGAQVERHYPGMLSPLERQGFERLAHSYQRGWFTAEARTGYAGLQSAQGRALSPPFTLHSRIEHGLWPWSQVRHGDWWPSAAYIDTTAIAAKQGGTGGALPRVRMLIALDGSGSVRIDQSALQWPAGEELPAFKAAEVHGRLDFGPDFSWFQGEADLRHLELGRGDSSRLTLENLSASIDYAASFGSLLLGEARISVGEATLRLAAPGTEIVLRGIEVIAQSTAEGALLEREHTIAVDARVASPRGWAKIGLKLQPEGLSGTGLPEPEDWPEHLSGEAALRMPESLSRKILAVWIRQRLLEGTPRGADRPSTKQQLEAQLATAVEQQLERLVRQELLVRDGNDLSLMARLAGGLLAINGRTFPLSLGELRH